MHNTTSHTTHHTNTHNLEKFETNPFVLIFKAFTEGMRKNQNAVVALLIASIAIGVIAQIPNMFNQFPDIFSNSGR